MLQPNKHPSAFCGSSVSRLFPVIEELALSHWLSGNFLGEAFLALSRFWEAAPYTGGSGNRSSSLEPQSGEASLSFSQFTLDGLEERAPRFTTFLEDLFRCK